MKIDNLEKKDVIGEYECVCGLTFETCAEWMRHYKEKCGEKVLKGG